MSIFSIILIAFYIIIMIGVILYSVNAVQKNSNSKRTTYNQPNLNTNKMADVLKAQSVQHEDHTKPIHKPHRYNVNDEIKDPPLTEAERNVIGHR